MHTRIRQMPKMLPSSSAIAEDAEILLHERNGFRSSLPQSGTKPASGADGKQRLAVLISAALIILKRILPRLHTDAYMAEQKIGSHCRTGTCKNSGQYQERIACADEKHDQISHKKDIALPRSFETTEFSA